MRLRRRPRFDTLQNEIRKRGRSWGRWVYLGLLCGFALWAFDLFLGNLVYFRAEGLVMRDRVVLATQFPAAVKELTVQEGSEVKANEFVAQVRSQSVEESFAKLSAETMDGLTRSAQLKIRDKVNEAIAGMADRRHKEAQAARVATESLRDQQLVTIGRRAELVKSELESAQSQSEIEAERRALQETLPDLESAVSSSKQAIERLRETYADGVVESPADGVVGYLHVSKGSVVRPGDPLMEIFTGPPYVLAYVPEGGLYELQPGDGIKIRIGFNTYSGQVSRLYPIAGQLPKEFQNTFQPVTRARIVRIEFDPTNQYPSLFTKTSLSAAGWPPAWFARMIRSATGSVTSAVAEPRPATNAPNPPPKANDHAN
jgi:multidrug resistance efflux pump